MQIVVNGRPHQIAESLTLAQLLEELQIRRDHCAVELNAELIPREKHVDQRLKEGDQLEIVTLVGGG
ncbi:MAG: sulfur carrier protein ThiS [Planctomycetaceae bacterium]|nr:sulfur carrier protein ThiS [Planctomycetaceae bacterium]